MRLASLFWQGAFGRSLLVLVFAGVCLMSVAPAFAQDTVPAVMNGLAAGSVFGFCVDAPRMLARPPDVFVWTRRGACIGLFFSVAQYCSKQGHAISPHNLLPEGTRAVRSEELKDPWSRATAPSRPGGPDAFANEETGQ